MAVPKLPPSFSDDVAQARAVFNAYGGDAAIGPEVGPPAAVAGSPSVPVSTPIVPSGQQLHPVDSAAPAMAPVQEQRTFVQGIKISPELLKKQEQLFEAKKQTIAEDAAIQTEIQKQAAQKIAEKNAEIDRIEADFFEKEKIRQQKAEEYQNKILDLEEKRKSFKINRDRIYEGKPGLFVLHTIAKFLGGFGSGITGTPNYAMNNINAQINADIESQKAEYHSLGDSVDVYKNLYGFARQGGLDDREAMNFAKSLKLDAIKRYTEGIAAKYGSPVIRNKAQELLNKQEEEQLKIKMEQQKDAQGKAQLEITGKPSSGQISNEDFTKLVSSAKENPTIKSAALVRTYYDEFKSLVRSGADSAAIASFIAKGLDQGSYGQEMKNDISNLGSLANITDYVQKKLVGKESIEFLRKLDNSLIEKIRATKRTAKPALDAYRSRGIPPNILIGEDTEADEIGKEKNFIPINADGTPRK